MPDRPSEAASRELCRVTAIIGTARCMWQPRIRTGSNSMTDYPDTSRDGQSVRPMAAGAASGTGSQAPAASFGDLKQKATRDLDELSEVARAGASEALDRSTAYAEEKKNIIADQLAGVAAAFEKVGGEMRQGEHAMVGRYARDLGGSAQRLARDLKGKDMADIVSLAEGFGRRQPVAFLGLAAIAGLAASRFVTASARRNSTGDTMARGDGASTSANPMAGRLKPEETGSPTATPTPQATRSTTGQSASGHEDRPGSPAFRPSSPSPQPAASPVRPATSEPASGIGGSGLGTSPDRPSGSRETPTLSPSGPNPLPSGRVSIGGGSGSSSDAPGTPDQSYNSTSTTASSEGANHGQHR